MAAITNLSKMMSDFDVIVVGGGPGGASAAIHLAASGARVLLAEQKRFPREKLCGEFISPECLEHFARLGVLGRMEMAGGSRVSETVFYTPSGRSLSVPSEWFGTGIGSALGTGGIAAAGANGDAAPGTRTGAALGLSRAEMDKNLLVRARESGVCVLEDAALAGVLVEGGRVVGVRLRVGGEEFKRTARVVIDATGRQRIVTRRAERELRGLNENGAAEDGADVDDGESEKVAHHAGETRGGVRHVSEVRARARLVAFKAHLEGARGESGICEIYFYPGGYGGLSPVEGGASNLCFIARARDVRARGSDAERVMREVLMRNRRAAFTLEGARAKTRWLGVSVESFGRHEPAPFDGLLAVGDAAAFIDPFTGSGMLMALESGELAALAVSRWLAEAHADGTQFDSLARDYRRSYGARFDSRLRVCGLLRRAAFAPTQLAELAAVALGVSTRLRRRLARSTRGSLRAGTQRSGVQPGPSHAFSNSDDES